MVAFLAALPAIFSAISGVTTLFSEGQKVYNDITGNPAPSDQNGLQDAVNAMTPDQQNQWAEAMAEKIRMYEAETDRLKVQGGTIDAETLSQFSQEARDKIGLLRMTTRPKVVLRMSHVMLLPVYVMAFDGIGVYANSILALCDQVYRVPMLAGTFFQPGSLYVELYGYAAPSATAIVISYITLREIGKAGGGRIVTGKHWNAINLVA